jgi:hypothetical protein
MQAVTSTPAKAPSVLPKYARQCTCTRPSSAVGECATAAAAAAAAAPYCVWRPAFADVRAMPDVRAMLPLAEVRPMLAWPRVSDCGQGRVLVGRGLQAGQLETVQEKGEARHNCRGRQTALMI